MALLNSTVGISTMTSKRHASLQNQINPARAAFARQNLRRTVISLPGSAPAFRRTAASELAAVPSKFSLAESAVQREIEMSHGTEATLIAAVPSQTFSSSVSLQPASLTTMVLTRPGMDIRLAMKPLQSLLSGPGSVFVAVIMAFLAAIAWIRGVRAHKTRNCATCGSYGVCRCSLCDGEGIISWEGKLQHSQICPACFGKRHCKCPDCGGMASRRLFQHSSAPSPSFTQGAVQSQNKQQLPAFRLRQD